MEMIIENTMTLEELKNTDTREVFNKFKVALGKEAYDRPIDSAVGSCVDAIGVEIARYNGKARGSYIPEFNVVPDVEKLSISDADVGDKGGVLLTKIGKFIEKSIGHDEAVAGDHYRNYSNKKSDKENEHVENCKSLYLKLSKFVDAIASNPRDYDTIAELSGITLVEKKEAVNKPAEDTGKGWKESLQKAAGRKRNRQDVADSLPIGRGI